MLREIPRRRWKSSNRLTPREDVPDDEHAPPLAHDLETLGHRAVHVGEALPFHATQASELHHRMQSPTVGSVRGSSTVGTDSAPAVMSGSAAIFVGHRARSLHGVARPLDRQRRLSRPRAVLPSRLPGHVGLGDHRLLHRVRVPPRDRRAKCGPHRPSTGVLRRPGRVQPGIGFVWAGADGGPSDRGATDPGRGSRGDAARVAGTASRERSRPNVAPRWWPCGAASAPWPWRQARLWAPC